MFWSSLKTENKYPKSFLEENRLCLLKAQYYVIQFWLKIALAF